MYFETLAFVVFLAHVSTAVSMALTVVTATVTSVPAGNVTSLNGENTGIGIWKLGVIGAQRVTQMRRNKDKGS